MGDPICEWSPTDLLNWAMGVTRTDVEHAPHDLHVAGMISNALRRGEEARLRVVGFENAMDLSLKSATEVTIVLRAIKALVDSVDPL